ncbi:MAG TPA: hypothetical protein VFG47_16075 [Geminicoccaceae bacterium]|nr:hypothetical protein [Geminicoccaceae bacterium]
MISRWYVGLFVALLALPPAPLVLWQSQPSPTTGNPMPDPCERAPNLPFCK